MADSSRDHRSNKEISRSNPEASSESGVSRRSLLRLGAMTGVGAALGGAGASASSVGDDAQLAGLDDKSHDPTRFAFAESTIAELQSKMANGELSSRRLVQSFLRRIRRVDQRGPGVNSVIETNPDALRIARDLDRERRQSGPRGPLHGIPVLLKDNIDTADSMQTAAGSLALVGTPPLQDATVAARLRDAGAVILGKAGLSEWANFRGFSSSSGWSGRGGQVNNPYIVDRNPCGSSSGSGASVSANLTMAALGTETDGSIVCPSSANGVVGIKPTVGLTSRAGVVPISDTQDTVGPHGRTVADAAAVLGALTGVDPRDAKTAASAGNSFTDYTQFLDPDSLAGTRIGVLDSQLGPATEETAVVWAEALAAMEDAGAILVPAELPTFDALNADQAEIIVLIFEFKRDLNAYLSTRTGVPATTVAEVIQFNLDNADEELRFFGQQFFELAEAEIFSEADYLAALERGPRLGGPEGIDAALANANVEALIAPTNTPAWPNDILNGDCFQFGSSSFAAVSGYPLVTVPAGLALGLLPVGVTFMGTAWSEPTLIRIASGFEAAVQGRVPPSFLDTLPLGAADRARAGANLRGAAKKHFDRARRARMMSQVVAPSRSIPRPQFL